MSLRVRYFLFIGLLHLLLGGTLYLLLQDNILFFLLSEVGLLVLFSLSIGLYRKLIRPIELMKNGTDAIRAGDFTIKYVKTGSKEMDKLIDVYNQMIDTLRKEKTKTVEQSYFLEKLIQVSPIGMIIMDYDGLISDINPMAKEILGISESWKNHAITDFEHPLILPITQIKTGEKKLFVQNGYERYRVQVDSVIHQGFARKFFIIEDLTKEILASEKEAYGKVIRMMAHEVNNSMGAINSILQTVYEFGFEHEDADDELKESLQIAVKRNKNLAKFMDNFADIIRLPSPQKTKENLNELLMQASKGWAATAKEKNIVIIYKLHEGNIPLEVDAPQIERVIGNALKNAIESIQEGGQIIIESQTNPPLFRIIDNGTGLSPEAEKDLFKPFFSTKAHGQGIGLMLCRDIIKNHGGKVKLFTNKKNGWTYFEVIFSS